MDFNEFLISTLESLVASIPQLVILGYTILHLLSKVKKTTDDFPLRLENTKDKMSGDFNKTKEEISNSYRVAKDEMLGIVSNFTTELKKDVKEEMNHMAVELKDYKQSLKEMSDSVKILNEENKAFRDILVTLVSKDPEKIRNEISSTITKRIQEADYDLRDFDTNFKGNSLKEVLKKLLSELGEEEFAKLLESVGYEETKKLS